MKAKILSGFISALLVSTSLPALAKETAVSEQFSNTLLTIAIVLGILASLYVFTLSLKMGGGAYAGSLLLYGVGMLSVVVSLLSVTWLKTFMSGFAGVSHDSFFIIGFILMVLGSRRVSNAIS